MRLTLFLVIVLGAVICSITYCNDRGPEEQLPIPDTIRIKGSILDTPIRINPSTIIVISTDSI